MLYCRTSTRCYSGIAGGGFRSLEEGQKVSYEATQGQKGMQAQNVAPV